MNGQDLPQPVGARDPHLVVLGVVDDERPPFHAGEEQRGARDARAHGRGRDDGGLAVGQQRDQASQPAPEQQIRLGLGGELQVRGQGGVPVGAHPVPVGEIVTSLRPHGGDGRRTLGGGELLGGKRRERRRNEPREDQ